MKLLWLLWKMRTTSNCEIVVEDTKDGIRQKLLRETFEAVKKLTWQEVYETEPDEEYMLTWNVSDIEIEDNVMTIRVYMPKR